MTEREELLDIAEAAAFLNVSETSLRRWTNSGALRHSRVGRRRERRFRREDLLAFMEHRGESAGAGPTTAGQASAAAAGHVLIDGAAIPLGAHLCALYTSDVGRAHLASRFLAGGLRPGSFCLLIAAPQAQEIILAELETLEGPLAPHLAAETLVVSDYARSMPATFEYVENQLRKAAQRGARTMRVVGDVSRLGLKLGDALADFENDYTMRIASAFPVVTLCQYDVRKFSGRGIYRAIKAHPHSTHQPLNRWLA